MRRRAQAAATVRRRALALLWLAGCGAPIVGQRQAVVGGVRDDGDPAVVMVLASRGRDLEICTGAVISPHVVLTAAHCVDPAVLGDPPPRFEVVTATALAEATAAQRFVVRETHADPTFRLDDLMAGHDVGVVVTEAALPAAPLPLLARALGDADVGRAVRLVGYGQTAAGTGGGERRTATSRVKRLTPELLEYGDARANTCTGDSGSPLLLDEDGGEVVAGVASFGDRNCVSNAFAGRIDRLGGFATPFVQRLDAPPAGCALGPRAAASPFAVALLLLVALALARRPL
jgi:secreted trypsin-like serine protease